MLNKILISKFYKILYFRKGKLSGITIYAPVPEVSMLDLTIRLGTESTDIYM